MIRSSCLEIFKNNNGLVRLFCFHYGGAGASMYKGWSEQLSAYLDLFAIQLPGRETRFNEPLLYNINTVVDEICKAIAANLDKPYIFFGHSIGALLCHKVAQELMLSNAKLPEALFVSGCRPPHMPLRRSPIHALPDQQFKAEVLRYNGIPKELIEHQENILEIYLPILRADFTLSETFQIKEVMQLSSNIFAFGGTHDSSVFEEDIKAWKEYTNKNFDYKMYNGDHFFIKEYTNDIISLLNLYVKNAILKINEENYV